MPGNLTAPISTNDESLLRLSVAMILGRRHCSRKRRKSATTVARPCPGRSSNPQSSSPPRTTVTPAYHSQQAQTSPSLETRGPVTWRARRTMTAEIFELFVATRPTAHEPKGVRSVSRLQASLLAFAPLAFAPLVSEAKTVPKRCDHYSSARCRGADEED